MNSDLCLLIVVDTVPCIVEPAWHLKTLYQEEQQQQPNGRTVGRCKGACFVIWYSCCCLCKIEIAKGNLAALAVCYYSLVWRSEKCRKIIIWSIPNTLNFVILLLLFNIFWPIGDLWLIVYNLVDSKYLQLYNFVIIIILFNLVRSRNWKFVVDCAFLRKKEPTTPQ